MTKPTNPNITIPSAFAINGQKTDFLEEKIETGFDPVDPDVLAGDNLNKLIDDTYKGLHYTIDGVSDLYKGVVLYDENETYNNKSIVFSINESGEVAIYLSLINENKGNSLTDTTKWKKVSLGGSGLEVGDIGIAALGIDESKGLRRYLNGTILTVNANTTAFVNKLKTAAALYPSLVCTESQWQSISAGSVGGQCGKFVINYDDDDTTVISVRLPKIIMPIQGLTNLTKLGELVEAGLPNITGLINVGFTEAQQALFNGQGALKEKENLIGLHGGGSVSDKTAGHKGGIELDASSSNDIYGNSTTVQQEQVQYPYFIQIATGQETEVNVVNEIELNNPYTLFDSKYTDAPLFNASWLKSDGTYHSKSVYVTVYEALMAEYNTEIEAGTSVQLPSGTTYTKRGLQVKLSTAEDITDYDFVINTSNESFRLPLTTKNRSLVDKEIGNLQWYNLYSDGWLEQGGVISTSITNIEPIHGEINLLKPYASTDYVALGTCVYGGDIIDFETRTASKLGYWIADRFYDVQSNEVFTWHTTGYANIPEQNLYFYVGETVQNSNLINAGRIAETFATKDFATSASAPSENYIDLTLAATNTTYIAPANGYIYLAKEATAQNQYIYLFSYTSDESLPVASKKIGTFTSAIGNGYWTETYLDVKKGDKFVVQYTLGGETHYFRFIYKQGEDMN